MSADQQSDCSIDEITSRIDAMGPTQWRDVAIRNALMVMQLRTALGTALAAMEIASALPAVEAEYDFSHAIKIAWDAYGHDGNKGASKDRNP